MMIITNDLTILNKKETDDIGMVLFLFYKQLSWLEGEEPELWEMIKPLMETAVNRSWIWGWHNDNRIDKLRKLMGIANEDSSN